MQQRNMNLRHKYKYKFENINYHRVYHVQKRKSKARRFFFSISPYLNKERNNY